MCAFVKLDPAHDLRRTRPELALEPVVLEAAPARAWRIGAGEGAALASGAEQAPVQRARRVGQHARRRVGGDPQRRGEERARRRAERGERRRHLAQHAVPRREPGPDDGDRAERPRRRSRSPGRRAGGPRGGPPSRARSRARATSAARPPWLAISAAIAPRASSRASTAGAPRRRRRGARAPAASRRPRSAPGCAPPRTTVSSAPPNVERAWMAMPLLLRELHRLRVQDLRARPRRAPASRRRRASRAAAPSGTTRGSAVKTPATSE